MKSLEASESLGFGAVLVSGHSCRGVGSLSSPLAFLVLASGMRFWRLVGHCDPTRLETRTKESNMCASARVIETPARRQLKSR